MKHGREARILHGSLLSCSLLCSLLLIVNLRSYVTKVRLTHPHCRVVGFGCAIFRDSPPSLPPTRRRSGDVHVKVCRSEGKSLVSHSSVLSEQSELILGVGPMKYSARYSQAGSRGKERRVFVYPSVLSSPYPRKIHRAWMLVFGSPQLPIHTDKTQSSLTVGWAAPPERWRCNNKKVFPALCAGIYGDVDQYQ